MRQAFYRVLAAQQSESIYTSGLQEIESVIRVLAERERQGEESKFDRLRTERERAEMLAELALVRATAAVERSQVQAFLPDGTAIPAVSGQLESPPLILNGTELTQRALADREDYRAEQRRLDQYRLEQRAAERLRFPEPIINAGLKRATVGQGVTANGPVVGITVATSIQQGPGGGRPILRRTGTRCGPVRHSRATDSPERASRRWIRSRISAMILGRPYLDRERHRQYRRKPARCPPTRSRV